jgi:hypothetical protein
MNFIIVPSSMNEDFEEPEFEILESKINTMQYAPIERPKIPIPVIPQIVRREKVSQKKFAQYTREEMYYNGLTKDMVAAQIGMSTYRINEILNCKGPKVTDYEMHRISKKLNFIY